MQSGLARHLELDRRMVAAVGAIRLLAALSWPAQLQQIFLRGWRRGAPQLPQPVYPRTDFSNVRAELRRIHAQADAGHPLGQYLRRSTASYIVCTDLLDAAGTPRLSGHSARLFCKPGDSLPGSSYTNLDAARHFIDLAAEVDAEADAARAYQRLEPLDSLLDLPQGIPVFLAPALQLRRRDLVTGKDAFANARIHPRRVQHRYWTNLGTTPLQVQRFGHLSAADLVSRQLEQMWKAADGSASELVVAVPAYMDTSHLGLFLGIAGELKLPVIALVDAAVAATRREYKNAVPVHIDIGLHATTLTRLAQPGHAQVERVEVLQDCGTYALYDIWLNTLAEAFVQQSRFDPLHTAETEQMLLDNLATWLARSAQRERVELELNYGGISRRLLDLAESIVGRIRGGLAQTNVVSSLFNVDGAPHLRLYQPDRLKPTHSTPCWWRNLPLSGSVLTSCSTTMPSRR